MSDIPRKKYDSPCNFDEVIIIQYIDEQHMRFVDKTKWKKVVWEFDNPVVVCLLKFL